MSMKIQQKPYLIYAGITAVVMVYYWRTWHSVGKFVDAMDYCETLSCDFVKSYYPTAKTIFTTSEPWINYIYASFFAVILHPLSLIPIEWAVGVWIVFQVGLMILLFRITSTYIVNQTYRYLYFFMLMTSFPILHNFKWGQLSMLITVLVVGSFTLYEKNRKLASAILLSFTIALKVYSMMFLIIYVLKKDWKTFWTCIACTIGFALAIPLLTMGYDPYWKFYDLSKIQLIFARPRWRTSENSEYIANVLMRLFHVFHVPKPNWIFFQIAGYLFLTLQLMGLWWKNRKESISIIHMMCLLFLLGPFWIETSWPHYFVYLSFCQIVILSQRNEKKEPLWITIGICLSMFISSIFCFNLFPSWVPYNGFGLLFFSNMVIIICFWIKIKNKDSMQIESN